MPHARPTGRPRSRSRRRAPCVTTTVTAAAAGCAGQLGPPSLSAACHSHRSRHRRRRPHRRCVSPPPLPPSPPPAQLHRHTTDAMNWGVPTPPATVACLQQSEEVRFKRSDRPAPANRSAGSPSVHPTTAWRGRPSACPSGGPAPPAAGPPHGRRPDTGDANNATRCIHPQVATSATAGRGRYMMPRPSDPPPPPPSTTIHPPPHPRVRTARSRRRHRLLRPSATLFRPASFHTHPPPHPPT